MTALSLLWLVQPLHSVCCAYKNHIKRFPVDTLVAPKTVQHLHVVERKLSILKAIGVHTMPRPALFLPQCSSTIRRAKQIVTAFRDPPVAVHVSIALKKKRWPRERFIRLLEYIATRHERSILMILDPRESLAYGHDLEVILQRCSHSIAQLASFFDLVALLSCCSEVVGHDSAIVHVAAGLGKPTFGIYVEENVQGYYPWAVLHVVLAGRKSAEDISVESACDGYARLLDVAREDIQKKNAAKMRSPNRSCQ